MENWLKKGYGEGFEGRRGGECVLIVSGYRERYLRCVGKEGQEAWRII